MEGGGGGGEVGADEGDEVVGEGDVAAAGAEVVGFGEVTAEGGVESCWVSIGVVRGV